MNNGAKEVNFDGLVGPTHNYSGLSYGNVASVANKQSIANPCEAALQGLEKMKFLADMGLAQAILPPHERPYLPILRELGYTGTDAAIWAQVARDSKPLLYACSSAAPMWTANAATVSPSVDSADGKVHFSPANLTAKFHRSIEAPTTARILRTIFADAARFVHHSALPGGSAFADEGAANHTRLCLSHGSGGVQFFVWGRSSQDAHREAPVVFPARQTLEASQALARRHLVDEQAAVFAQQNPRAIDAGVFHNDVIAVGNQNVLLCHEEAFVAQDKVIAELKSKVERACGCELIVITVPSGRISLEQAVATYLFNSQLLTLPDGTMAIVAPSECERNTNVHNFLGEVISDRKNPVTQVHYLNLHESMRNGGGPACLRLRIVLNEDERKSMHQGVILTDALYHKLREWVQAHYRDRLLPEDLADPQLIAETRRALDALTQILDLGPIYEFQR